MLHDVEPVMTINLTVEELKILIKEMISDYMLEYSKNNKASKSDLFSHAEIFQKFFLRPQILEDWREKGLIESYRIGDAYKFKLFDVFKTVKIVIEAKEKREVVSEHP